MLRLAMQWFRKGFWVWISPNSDDLPILLLSFYSNMIYYIVIRMTMQVENWHRQMGGN